MEEQLEPRIDPQELNEFCYCALLEIKQSCPLLRERIESLIRQWTIISDIDKGVITFYFLFRKEEETSLAKELTRIHRLGSMTSEQFVKRAQALYIENGQ